MGLIKITNQIAVDEAELEEKFVRSSGLVDKMLTRFLLLFSFALM
jgi:hypothetical protein